MVQHLITDLFLSKERVLSAFDSVITPFEGEWDENVFAEIYLHFKRKTE